MATAMPTPWRTGCDRRRGQGPPRGRPGRWGSGGGCEPNRSTAQKMPRSGRRRATASMISSAVLSASAAWPAVVSRSGRSSTPPCWSTSNHTERPPRVVTWLDPHRPLRHAQDAYFITSSPTRGSAASTFLTALPRTARYALTITGLSEISAMPSVIDSRSSDTSGPRLDR